MLFKKCYLIFGLLLIINFSKQSISQKNKSEALIKKIDFNAEIAICEENYSQVLTIRQCEQLQKEFDDYIDNLKNNGLKTNTNNKQISKFIKKITQLKNGLESKKIWLKYYYDSDAEMLLTFLSIIAGCLIIFINIFILKPYFKDLLSLKYFWSHRYNKNIFDIPNFPNWDIFSEINENINFYNDNFKKNGIITYNIRNLSNLTIALLAKIIIFYIFINLITNHVSSFEDYCFNALMLKRIKKNNLINYQINFQNCYYFLQNNYDDKIFVITLKYNNNIYYNGNIYELIAIPFHNYRYDIYNWISIISYVICIIANFILIFNRSLTTPLSYAFVIYLLLYKFYSILDYYCLFNKQHHLFNINCEPLKQYLKHLPIVKKYYFQEQLPNVKEIIPSILLFISLLLLTIIFSIGNFYILETAILKHLYDKKKI